MSLVSIVSTTPLYRLSNNVVTHAPMCLRASSNKDMDSRSVCMHASSGIYATKGQIKPWVFTKRFAT